MAYQRLIPYLAVAALAVAFAIPANAQDYPSRQVTIVVPFAPGGSVDIVGRLVAQKLAERLGKPFIVENRPGAGTATATTAVAKSAPDGHTLLFAPSGTYAINPTLYKQLAYDPLRDLTMVALVTRDPLLLVVNPSLPVKSAADLVKYAKDNPGKVSFATTGPGTSLSLLGELLKFTAKIDIVPVSYRGGAQALQDVIAGQAHMMFSDPASAVPQAQAGKVRALGVSSATRLPVAPDIPTISEAGLPFAIEFLGNAGGSRRNAGAHRGADQRRIARGHGAARHSATAHLARPSSGRQPVAAGARSLRQDRAGPLGRDRAPGRPGGVAVGVMRACMVL